MEYAPSETESEALSSPRSDDVPTMNLLDIAGREEFLAADKEDPMERLNSNLYGYERALAERPPRR